MAQRPKRKVDEFSGVANVITDRPVPDCLAFQFRCETSDDDEFYALDVFPTELRIDISRYIASSIRIYMQVDVITALADGPSHSLSTS
ncbi:hypothetical protein TWF569_006679 [Orbilia oligospora]|nr:hypothetical protein TWF569_006679 [Orbilia oligospora]